MGTKVGGMETPPKAPNRISKRVLAKWEKLVYGALQVENGKASSSRPDYRKAQDYTGTGSSYVVPQSLSQQTNIDAILQTADEIQSENPQVARIWNLKVAKLFPWTL